MLRIHRLLHASLASTSVVATWVAALPFEEAGIKLAPIISHVLGVTVPTKTTETCADGRQLLRCMVALRIALSFASPAAVLNQNTAIKQNTAICLQDNRTQATQLSTRKLQAHTMWR